MIEIDYNAEEHKFLIHYTGTDPIKIQFWVIDLNTNLTAHGWYSTFGGIGNSEWIVEDEYFTSEYNSGFEIVAYVNEEQVFNKKFQFKKLNNKFYFSSSNNELNFGSWQSLVYGQEYDVELSEYDIVYDLGANFGVYTMYALNKGVKQVYAFEPTPNNVNHLKETFKFDKNVQIIDKAIASENKTTTFWLHPHSVGNSLINNDDNHPQWPIEVGCINLEQWIKDNNAKAPTIIKCDIEGAEYEFIESLSDDFFDNIHTFIVEYHVAVGRHYFELLKRFFNLGYKIHYNYKNALEINRGTFIAEKHHASKT